MDVIFPPFGIKMSADLPSFERIFQEIYKIKFDASDEKKATYNDRKIIVGKSDVVIDLDVFTTILYYDHRDLMIADIVNNIDGEPEARLLKLDAYDAISVINHYLTKPIPMTSMKKT